MALPENVISVVWIMHFQLVSSSSNNSQAYVRGGDQFQFLLKQILERLTDIPNVKNWDNTQRQLPVQH